MEIFLAICNGTLRYKGRKVVRSDADSSGNTGANRYALIGDCTVRRESAITGDERCKEKFTCRLSSIETKYAFLNSQSLEQMTAGDAKASDAQATLDFDEFLEAIARCARDKYGEIKLMSLGGCVRGVIQNIFGEKSDEAVIRDATYIHTDRFDWKLSTPLPDQPTSAHSRWLSCWQNIEIADLHHFPLWEKGVFDCLRACFKDLTNIFAHYSKSIAGSTTAEDAVEMTMTEFKKMVKDVNLETADFRWEQITVLFMKANAVNSNAAHFQRKDETGTADAKAGSAIRVAASAAAFGRKLKSAAAQKDTEKDAELVLYEFVELLVRIAFQRANPKFGASAPPPAAIPAATAAAAAGSGGGAGSKPISPVGRKLVPLPDCLQQMLHDVILPRAKRDESAQFRERLETDKPMQAVFAAYEKRLRAWFDVHTQETSAWGSKPRNILYQQWQDLLEQGGGGYQYGALAPGFTPGHEVGTWQIKQDSEITGDERCKNVFKVTFSMAMAKASFTNSQSLEQLTVGQMSATDAMLTLDCAFKAYCPLHASPHCTPPRPILLTACLLCPRRLTPRLLTPWLLTPCVLTPCSAC